MLFRSYLCEVNSDAPEALTMQRTLRVGGDAVGAIVVRGDINPLTADALASLAAITFERHLSFEKARHAEAVRQSEQLRAAVLDALAHAFKTPLTVIRTASSGLLDSGSLSESQTELATLIDEESIHLSQMCTDLLQTAKLKAEEIGPEQNEVIPSQMINHVLSELSETLLGHEINVSIAPQATCIHADRNLLATILTQYLDNAGKYSDPDAPISIAVQESPAAWLLSVRSRGDIIPLQDRERIFERFYRSEEGRQRAAGAGVGLSIVKKMAEAHQGHVWVISNEEEGTTFFLSVPKLK